jgi:glycosyltransferase involved in cell wall biosynthesis
MCPENHPTDIPIVTVIIATYNRAGFISQAIGSVLSQSENRWELIIVDDGSTDNTNEVVAEHKDPRIFYQRVEHGERSRARNAGIRRSKGKFIAFLDSDDWFLPDKLHDQVLALEIHPNAGMAFGGWEVKNQAGQTIRTMMPWENIEGQPTVEDWLFSTTSTPISLIVRKDCLTKYGGFNPELNMSEDIELWMRLAINGCEIVWSKTIVGVVLAHETNSLRDWPKVHEGRLRFLDTIFANPMFSKKLSMSKEHVYSRFYLNMAWLAYDSGLLPEGASDLNRAVEFDPLLVDNQGEKILVSMLDYSQYFLVQAPFAFIDRVFEGLPQNLKFLKKSRNLVQSKLHLVEAWRAKSVGDFHSMRINTFQAVYHKPTNLFKRGILSMLVQSLLGIRIWQRIHP